MYSFVFKHFMRSRATVTGLVFLLVTGLVSLFIGQRFLKQQKETASFVAAHQQEHIQRNKQFFHSEMGLLLYYLRFSLINQTDPLAGVSLGQRDVNPSIQSLTIRNLENQRYDTDLNNPVNLLLGNLDLGFVMIYLFPLLIIAYTYNLWSEEKEGGTWSLIRIQAASPLNILWTKFFFRMLVVFAAAIILMISAVILLSLPFNKALLAVAILFTLYLLFWFVLSYWMVSWRRNAAFNAVSMLSLWVVLTILFPSLINNYVSNAYPLPEALETAVKQRQGYHEKWDMDKRVTMDRFYAHYPQFRKYPLPDKEFSWLWYYAMQQMGDDDARQESEKLRSKILLRDKISRKAALFVPPLYTQLCLNSLARTDLQDYTRFLDSTARFHEKTKLSFYPGIFEEQPVQQVNWGTFKAAYFRETPNTRLLEMALPLVIISALLLGWGRYNFYKPTPA